MKRKKGKKIKLKINNILIFFILLICLATIIWKVLNTKIRVIYVLGNDTLTEQEILSLCDLYDYPKYYQISKSKMIKRLKTNPIIKNAKIKKKLTSLTLEILEYDIIAYMEYDSSILLFNLEKIYVEKKPLGIPILTNQIEGEYIELFIEKMLLIDKNVLSKISEITYEPTELDQKRFLLYMNDQNYVYLTLDKFDYINKYEELLPKLEGKKGILYLDSGNHFEIKKNN